MACRRQPDPQSPLFFSPSQKERLGSLSGTHMKTARSGHTVQVCFKHIAGTNCMHACVSAPTRASVKEA